MKTIFFLLFLIVSHYSMALDLSTPCPGISSELSFHELDSLHQHLEQFGATENNVYQAPCKTKTMLSKEELENFINEKFDAKKNTTTQVVNGVKLKDSPLAIETFKNLTTQLDGFGIGPSSKGQINFQQKFKINPECSDVLCAVKKIWGEDFGPKMLHVKLKYGYNMSEYAFNNSDPLTKEEMNDIMLAISDLPSHFSSLGNKNQRLTHFKRGSTLAMYAQSPAANAVIMLFDPWSEMSPPRREYAIFHELAHNIGTKLNNLDSSKEWLNLSGWVKKGDEWQMGKDKCAISDYSKTNPDEDFAEAVTTYRYNGKQLKETCPSKYNFIKSKVFKNKEYLSQETCSDFSPEVVKLALSGVKQIVTDPLADNMNDLKNTCPFIMQQFPYSEEIGNDCQKAIVKEKISLVDFSKLKGSKDFKELNSITKEQLVNSVTDKMIADEDYLKSSGSTLIEKIKKENAEYFDNLINESLPKIVDGKLTNFKNGIFLKSEIKNKCIKYIWSNDNEEFRNCAFEALLINEKKWQEVFDNSFYLEPIKMDKSIDSNSKEEIYKKRLSRVKDEMLNKDILDSIILDLPLETKKFISESLLHRSKLLKYADNEWKKMSAEEFCKTKYDRPDKYESYYLPVGSTNYPGFLDWCIKTQEAEKKRFIFQESDFKNYTDLNIVN